LGFNGELDVKRRRSSAGKFRRNVLPDEIAFQRKTSKVKELLGDGKRMGRWQEAQGLKCANNGHSPTTPIYNV